MVVSPAHRSPVWSLHHRMASAPITEPQDVWDSSVRNEYLSGGLRYGMAKAEGMWELAWGPGLSESPSVGIDTPLLVMPGFLGPEGQFQGLLEHLTTDGANGGRPYYVRDGQIFEDPKCTRPAQPDSEARVFRVVLHDIQDGPEKGADQLALAQPAVAAFTGRHQLDLLAHSQGGIAARLHADRGHSVRKLMMVGTPNQGSRAAHLTMVALKNGVSWASSMAGVGPQALPALEWLSPGNSKLNALNSRLERQKAHTESMVVVGSDGFLSPIGPNLMGPGDGLIPTQALAVGDLEVRMVSGAGSKCHYTMMNDPEIFAEMVAFYGWS